MSVRFAPSPTGTFHIGNLRTAWISHLLAKKLAEKWVLRFEDIDKPRVLAGAQESQLADMQSLGMVPDEVLVQSQYYDRHVALFNEFKKRGWVYPCFCSRKQVRDALDLMASAPHDNPAQYNGACRYLTEFPNHNLPTIGWRLKMPAASGVQDFIIGRTNATDPIANPGEGGGFVPAYNWACAIDDYDGHYDLLVRAWDLASALAFQRAIQSKIAELEGSRFDYPAVFYCSLVVQNDGHRLEKRTKGVTLAELIKGGISVEGVLNCFKRSFDIPNLQFPKGALLGEENHVLRLNQLQLPLID